MGFVLLVLSVVLVGNLFWIGVLFAVIRFSFKKGKLNSYFRSCAVSLDQTGGVIMSPFFNVTMIKKGGHKFGDIDETISSVFGRNLVSGHLTRFGKFWQRLLDKIEQDHSINSIGN